jgi:predicted nucleic-acid-binding Zn-ribbon protein
MRRPTIECPKCGSGNLEGDPARADSGEAWQHVTCQDCEHTWFNVYKFSHVEEAG